MSEVPGGFMRFKCPHCQAVKDYREPEYREIYIRCKSCGREFRAAESSPLTASAPGVETGDAVRRMFKKTSSQSENQGKRTSVAKLNAEAAIYIKRGDYDRAMAGLKESLRQRPNQPHVERLLRKISNLRSSP